MNTEDTNATRRGSVLSEGLGLVERLRNTPNWQRESFEHWKTATSVYDRAPFEAADEIERLRAEVAMLRATMEEATYQLSKARIWGGMDWHYNPLHPMHYKPALDKMREVLDGPNGRAEAEPTRREA